jgi:hypothetical protein
MDSIEGNGEFAQACPDLVSVGAILRAVLGV